MHHKKLFIALLLAAGGQSLQAAEPDPALVATPRAKVLATSAGSRPFLGAARTQQPVDLAARGYVESEVTVSGHADGQAWATRMLVRRPRDARVFSGRVIVEALDAAAPYESAALWGFSWEYFLRRGDAWAGVTTSPAVVGSLRKFNAARYAQLNLVAGEPGSCQAVPQRAAAAADVMAQAAALLRSSSKENPLWGLNPQRMLAAGYSGGGDFVAGFAATAHRMLRLGDGGPIFDGYLSVSGLTAVSPSCIAVLPRGVPFVSVLTETDITRAPDRHQGDAQSEGLRVYEIAGTAGARPSPASIPVAADLAAAGIAAPAAAACREPLMDQALAHSLNAIWQQLDDLIVLKQPMATLPPIEIDPVGNRLGGWRLPQVDLPLAGVAPVAPRTCNAATGSMQRFDAVTLKRLYRDRNEYLRSFNAAVDAATTSRLLVKEDASALKTGAARSTPQF